MYQFLSTTFTTYQHTSGVSAIRTRSLTMPASISPLVDDIFPLLTFGTPTPLGRVERFNRPSHAHRYTRGLARRDILPGILPSCSSSAVTLSQLRTFYGYDSYEPASGSSTPPAIGMLGYTGQDYSFLDLDLYLSTFRPEAKGYSITVNTSDGALNLPLPAGIEADLDTQTIGGMVYPLPSSEFLDTLYLTQVLIRISC